MFSKKLKPDIVGNGHSEFRSFWLLVQQQFTSINVGRVCKLCSRALPYHMQHKTYTLQYVTDNTLHSLGVELISWPGQGTL